ncbi:MAG: hypothetical protein ACREM1_01395 [Longimicrobiales bacterium]
MMRSAISIRGSARPGARVLAVMLMLAMAAVPVVDGWLHAGDATAAAAQHTGASDCVVCRLASTPSAPSAGPETTITEAAAEEPPRLAPEEVQLRPAPARLRPPTRAPPA